MAIDLMNTTERDALHKTAKVKSRKRQRSKEAEIEALNDDLEQIGKLSLNINLISLNLPSLTLPSLSNLPKFELGRLQDYSKELTAYFSSYITKDKSIGNEQEYRHVVNSVKTALFTRIQMTTFLHDLQLGESINSAIDRLQPLTDIIHETVFSPVDDLFEDDKGETSEEEFEPMPGVERVVNTEIPLFNNIVKPELDSRRRSNRHWKSKLHESDDQTGSDLDHIEGLSEDRIRELSDLTSLDDIVNEDLLRSKIKEINRLTCLTQVQKNKLVTRLMMGNYYKYMKQKLPPGQIPSKLKNQRLVLQADEESLDVIDEHHSEHDHAEHHTHNHDHDHHDHHTSSHNHNQDKDYLHGNEDGQDLPDLELQESNDMSDSEEVFLNDSDFIPTYYNKAKDILGCQHYQRNCKLECPTCLKWFTCRFCHDLEVTDHKMKRNAVKHVLCMKCNTPQEPDTNDCVNCEEELASYFCTECVLYDNDPTKDIYHCDKCQICRLGLGIGKDYFHCDKCNICLSIDLREKHKCVTNSTHSNCPICNEYLFTSVHKVVFMKCGHSIHQTCYDEMVKHSYKCPICKKTVVNVETQFRILDQEILQQPLPSPYNLWRCIISCNECKGKSNVNYHILGLKCKYCKSYNTNQLKLIKPEEENDNDDFIEVENNFDEDVIRSVENNILTNFRIGDGVLIGNSIEDNEISYEDEGDDEGGDESDLNSIFDYTRLARKDINNKVGYISSILQDFVNSTTKGINRDRSVSNVSNDDMIGGF